MEEVFIPERYLTHKEILRELPGKGWGLYLAKDLLSVSIKNGRIHPNVLVHRAVTYIIEKTGIKDEKHTT